ncbi:hypothetical protein IWZ03DRAFT_247060 [Phyllosticta citriasiana]|uniref:Transmembrane protein n=1 Tax=Phyllosticta citriasiana TaxID=595635 RepID=A0ABR1KG24_9PEZI
MTGTGNSQAFLAGQAPRGFPALKQIKPHSIFSMSCVSLPAPLVVTFAGRPKRSGISSRGNTRLKCQTSRLRLFSRTALMPLFLSLGTGRLSQRWSTLFPVSPLFSQVPGGVKSMADPFTRSIDQVPPASMKSSPLRSDKVFKCSSRTVSVVIGLFLDSFLSIFLSCWWFCNAASVCRLLS